MHLNENGSSNTTDICNLFADHFKSVYSSSSQPYPETNKLRPIADISDFKINISDVADALVSLDSKTSLDIDSIANIILKKCSVTISLPLYIIFSVSLSTGIFLKP